MINIRRNKQLFARQTRQQIDKLELKMYRSIYPVLKNIFNDTASMIKHGDPLNIIPVVVNRYTAELSNAIVKNYRIVGANNYKQVTDRLQEIKPKKIVDYYFKDSQNSFWFYFDNWTKQQAASKVTKINTTTKDLLRTIINKGVKEGKSYVEIAKMLKDVELISSKKRAMTIAITETHTAFNKSIFESIESTLVKMETKEWLNANDERVRDKPFDHVRANGETVRMDDTFVNTGEPLMYPGDPDGSPANIIRCRCVNLYHTAMTEIKPVDETQQQQDEEQRVVEKPEETNNANLISEENISYDDLHKQNLYLQDKFTADELDSMTKYRSSGFERINNALREGKIDYYAVDIKKAIKKVKPLKNDMIVYRGMVLKEDSAFIPNLIEGNTVTDKAFMSVAYNKDNALKFIVTKPEETNDVNFIFKIKVPKGTKILDMFNKSESEFLLNTDSKLKIKSITDIKENPNAVTQTIEEFRRNKTYKLIEAEYVN